MPTPLSGPRGLPLLGCLPQYAANPLAFFSHVSRDYGDIARFRIGGEVIYMLNHPRHIESLLVGKYRHCVKDRVTKMLMPVVGEGLLTSEGDFWRRQRRLAAPPLQPRRIASYGATMVDATSRLLKSMRDHEVRNVSTDMMQLTLQVVSRTLFSEDTSPDAARIGAALDDLIDFMTANMQSWEMLVPRWIPTRTRRRLKSAIADLDEIIYRMIRTRRARQEMPDDLLSRLLQAQDEDGSRMSDRQLRDEMVTLMLAGHETTALALAFALYLLSEHPDVHARIRDELARELAGRLPTVEDMPRLRYLEAVGRETLRLYPPAYAIGREAISDLELDGHLLPKGSQIVIAQWALHRDPRFFPEPQRFRPERWLEPEAADLPRFAYFPFGGGPRVCIGNHFAMLELTLILATLLQQVSLTAVPGTELKLRPAVTLRLADPLRMIVRRHRPSSHPPPSLAATGSTANVGG